MDFRKDSKRIEPLAMFSQSSLTDIILLLLIFFLLTSSFVTNFGIRINLPRAEAGSVTDNQNVTVAITADGGFFVDGGSVQQANLVNEIRTAHQNKPGSSLIIRADSDSRHEDVVRVMNISQALNMNIHIATEREIQ